MFEQIKYRLKSFVGHYFKIGNSFCFDSQYNMYFAGKKRTAYPVEKSE